MTQLNKVFMAFASGSESKEETPSFKNYIGVGAYHVVGINPSKKELEGIYGREIKEEPVYISKDVDGVPQVRIDFIVKTDPAFNNGIELTTKATIFLKRKGRRTTDGSKIQYINQYGDTAWLTDEQAKSEVIPENLSRFIVKNIRPIYEGEENLVKFLKAYIGIPQVCFAKKGEAIKMIADPTTAEALLEKVENYFKGDISEIKQAIGLQPNNRVKLFTMVKLTDDNKKYQAICMSQPMKFSQTNYTYSFGELEKEIANGRYANHKYSIRPLEEYSEVIKPTSFDIPSAPADMGWFNAPQSDDLPY